MRDYRVYEIGEDGHFAGVHELSCEDDMAAEAAGRILVKDRDMEVWQGARRVGLFIGKSGAYL